MVTNYPYNNRGEMNIKEYINAIQSTDLFNCFTKGELLSTFNSSNCSLRKYEKGQIIHIQNELCDSMDMIMEGRASVQKIDEGGNILKIADFSDCDIIGANLLFSDNNSYPMTIISESKTIILKLFKDFVLELGQKNISFMANLLKVISNKTLVLSGKIDAISFKTIRQRIMDFLMYEYHIQKNNVITLNLSKKDLAERLGVQRTSLSRELNKMRNDGLVEYDAKTITIKY